MNNIDSSRTGFFPNSTTAQKQKANALKKSFMARNTLTRKNELDQMAKRDSKVEIGNAVKDFARIKKAVDAAPDIDNTDKISLLKSQIKAGTYKVDYDGLADKILNSEY